MTKIDRVGVIWTLLTVAVLFQILSLPIHEYVTPSTRIRPAQPMIA